MTRAMTRATPPVGGRIVLAVALLVMVTVTVVATRGQFGNSLLALPSVGLMLAQGVSVLASVAGCVRALRWRCWRVAAVEALMSVAMGLAIVAAVALAADSGGGC